MARTAIERFDQTTEKKMREFCQTLSEKDQKRYAAIEAWRLGYGAITYVAEVLGCSTRTISRGMNELEAMKTPASVDHTSPLENGLCE